MKKTSLYTVALLLLSVVLALSSGSISARNTKSLVFVDCPESLVRGSHCDTLRCQVKAVVDDRRNPDNNSVRYRLVSGPGEIDGHTGEWVCFHQTDSSSARRRWHEVVIAASIGNSPVHVTPPEEYCRFRVDFRDRYAHIYIDNQDMGAVFSVTAPGTYTFTVRVDDPDWCDPQTAYIYSVEPEPVGSFILEGDLLTFNVDAADAEQAFTLLLSNDTVGDFVRAVPFVFDTHTEATPTFVDCPDTIVASLCATVQYQVKAVPPDTDLADFVEYEIVSGPGRIVESSGLWYFTPSSADIGQTYEVEIAAAYGDFTTTGDENCHFYVPVFFDGTGIAVLYPEGTLCGDTLTVLTPTTHTINGLAYDPINCAPMMLSIASIEPAPTGSVTLEQSDQAYFELIFNPDTADGEQVFTVTLEGTSGVEPISCAFSFETDWQLPEPPPPPPELPTIRIDMANDVQLCSSGQLDVILDGPTLPIGGFDLLIEYDLESIVINQVTPGVALFDDDGCGWEYFSYRFGQSVTCNGVACPPNVISVIALAEINNGSIHPSCFEPTSVPATLFSLEYVATCDAERRCQDSPVRFLWADCGYNMLCNPIGDTTYIARDVYDFDGTLLQPADDLPSYGGVPHICFDSVYQVPHIPMREYDFENGGISFDCPDTPPGDCQYPRGDLNGNLVAYEVADAVLFSNYFVYGMEVFTKEVDCQVWASDVNGDGVPLGVDDFIYLISVVLGDAVPYPTTPAMPVATFTQTSSGGVYVDLADSLGGVLMIFNGEIAPVLAGSNMSFKYKFDGLQTRVLIYSFDGESVAAGKLLDETAGATLMYVGASTPEGIAVDAIIAQPTFDSSSEDILPTKFALKQNYPNPFNPSTTVEFDLPRSTLVTFEVINLLGQTVYRFSDTYPAGSHQIVWNGIDIKGQPVASGIYHYRLTTPNNTAVRKMLLLK